MNVLRAFFLTFRRIGGSEKRVHSVHLVHHRLERSIWPSKLAKNEIWRRNDWEPINGAVRRGVKNRGRRSVHMTMAFFCDRS